MKKLIVAVFIAVCAVACGNGKTVRFEDTMQYEIAKSTVDFWKNAADSLQNIIASKSDWGFDELNAVIRTREECKLEQEKAERELKDKEELFYTKEAAKK